MASIKFGGKKTNISKWFKLTHFPYKINFKNNVMNEVGVFRWVGERHIKLLKISTNFLISNYSQWQRGNIMLSIV